MSNTLNFFFSLSWKIFSGSTLSSSLNSETCGPNRSQEFRIETLEISRYFQVQEKKFLAASLPQAILVLYFRNGKSCHRTPSPTLAPFHITLVDHAPFLRCHRRLCDALFHRYAH